MWECRRWVTLGLEPMRLLKPVQTEAMDPRRFEQVISTEEYQDLLAVIGRAAAAVRRRVIWNVDSTATGRGVAEPLLGPHHLRRQFELIEQVMASRERERTVTVWAPSSVGAV